MSFASIAYPADKAGRYDLLLAQLRALTDGVAHPLANLANAAALLWQGLPEINWCGFYLMDGGALLLGPFCGLPAFRWAAAYAERPRRRMKFSACTMCMPFPGTSPATARRMPKS